MKNRAFFNFFHCPAIFLALDNGHQLQNPTGYRTCPVLGYLPDIGYRTCPAPEFLPNTIHWNVRCPALFGLRPDCPVSGHPLKFCSDKDEISAIAVNLFKQE